MKWINDHRELEWTSEVIALGCCKLKGLPEPGGDVDGRAPSFKGASYRSFV